MFFSKLPNIEYDKKPVSFPLSEQHYILAKNFFRRTSFIKNSFPNVVYFNKYTMTDEDRLDLLSQRFYGSPNYDWVILLTNNIINTNYDLPIRESCLYEFVYKQYASDDYDPAESYLLPPDRTHHYETIEQQNSLKEVVLQGGLIVDKNYYTTNHTFYDRGTQGYLNFTGSSISKKVSNFDYEKQLNDSKRDIFILKSRYLPNLVSEFESLVQYSSSNSFISKTVKKSGQ